MQDLSGLFKDLLWDNLIKLALSNLFAAVPFLGWGPVGWFVTYIVTKYSDQFYAVMEMHFDLQAIAFKNEELRLAYDSASVKLKSSTLLLAS